MLSGVLIVEVQPADADPFVELLNPTSAPVDLTDFAIVSPASRVSLSGALGPGERASVAATDLFPKSTQSGEVALIDGSGTVQSYLAWGSDPSAAGSTLFVQALQSGAGSTGSVVAVPYPRPVDSSIVREGGFIGCFTPTPGAGPSGTACAVPAATLVLREVGPGNSPLTLSFVEFENTSAAVVDLTGVRICHDGECTPIPAFVNPEDVNDPVNGTRQLIAGGTFVVCLGPVSDASVCPAAGLPLTGSTPIQGDTETFLAAPGTGFDAAAIIDYMRTFGGRETFAATAIADGLWADGIEPLGTYVRGETLSRNPSPLFPPAWNPARASPGVVNPTIDRATNWESCTEPAAAAAVVPAAPAGAAELLITIVSRVDGTITLSNLGSAPIPLAGFLVTVDDAELQENGIPLEGQIAPNTGRTIPIAVNDSGKLEVRIRADNTLLQFAQWGNPAAGVTAAVTANRWPREDCVLPRLATAESLVARIPVIDDVRDRSLLRGSSAFDVQ